MNIIRGGRGRGKTIAGAMTVLPEEAEVKKDLQSATMTRRLVKGYGEIFLPTDNILDQSATKEILDGDTYPKIASQANIIWDVGANIGAATLYFAKQYPSAQIRCFEPSQDIVWDCLKENTNRIRSRRHLYPFGLAGEGGERPMNEWRDSTVTRSCKQQTHELVVQMEPAEFRRPPDASGVTIIKIDTEGCEVEILEAIDAVLRFLVPVYYIEYHSETDRRKIDELLPDHQLVRAASQRKHRGNLCYLHGSINTVEDKLEIT